MQIKGLMCHTHTKYYYTCVCMESNLHHNYYILHIKILNFYDSM